MWFTSISQVVIKFKYILFIMYRRVHLQRLHFANLAESSQGTRKKKMVKLVKDFFFIYYIFTPRFRAHKLVANGL